MDGRLKELADGDVRQPQNDGPPILLILMAVVCLLLSCSRNLDKKTIAKNAVLSFWADVSDGNWDKAIDYLTPSAIAFYDIRPSRYAALRTRTAKTLKNVIFFTDYEEHGDYSRIFVTTYNQNLWFYLINTKQGLKIASPTDVYRDMFLYEEGDHVRFFVSKKLISRSEDIHKYITPIDDLYKSLCSSLNVDFNKPCDYYYVADQREYELLSGGENFAMPGKYAGIYFHNAIYTKSPCDTLAILQSLLYVYPNCNSAMIEAYPNHLAYLTDSQRLLEDRRLLASYKHFNVLLPFEEGLAYKLNRPKDVYDIQKDLLIHYIATKYGDDICKNILINYSTMNSLLEHCNELFGISQSKLAREFYQWAFSNIDPSTYAISDTVLTDTFAIIYAREYEPSLSLEFIHQLFDSLKVICGAWDYHPESRLYLFVQNDPYMYMKYDNFVQTDVNEYRFRYFRGDSIYSDMAVNDTRLLIYFMHELGHFIQSSKYGANYFNEVPRWFSEGPCYYLSHDWDFRSSNSHSDLTRLDTLLFSYEQISDWPKDGFSNDACIQYSYKMIEYFMEKFDMASLQDISSEVSDGIQFDRAFEDITGLKLKEFYSEWHRHAIKR